MKRSIHSAKFVICLGFGLLLSGGLIYILSDLNFPQPAQAAQDQEKERKEAANQELASQLRVERIADQDARAGSVREAFDELIGKAQDGERVRVIVGLRVAFQPEGRLANRVAVLNQRLAIAQSQSRLLGRMPALDVTSVKRFDYIPFLAMEVDLAALQELEKDQEVASIQEDIPVRVSLTESIPLVGAPAAWAAGFSGTGQHVAVLDTGVDKAHPFLTGKVVSEACYSTTSTGVSSVCPGGVTQTTDPNSGVPCTSPAADCLHGTHVAGIAAGKGTSFFGVARDANLIAIQVFSRGASSSVCGPSIPCLITFPSDVILGLQRVQALSSSLKIAAVNLSLGGGKSGINCDASEMAYKAAIDNLRSVGIATVAASGNDGFTASTGRPACVSSAISVGSTGDGTGGTVVNGVSSFSDTASFLNLFAPGELISSSTPGGAFMALRGTSMAAPHVAGAWAALKSKTPNASVSQVLMALQGTGLPVTDARNGIIKPRIRVDAAAGALSTTACDYSLSAAAHSLNAAGGAGTTNVTSASGCAWTAISNVPWITVNSGATGAGNGGVNFSVAANPGLDRAGTLVIAGQTFIVNQTGLPSLAVDDGNHEGALGLTNGGTIHAVNRLTPASYPAAINQVAVFIPSRSSVPVGASITVIYAANPSGSSSIGAVNFNTVNGTVQALDQFNCFSIPPFAITAGDFLVGFRLSHSPNALPVVFDQSPPLQRRSYVSIDGASFTLIDNLGSLFAGNIGIRALLAPRAVARGGSTLQAESCFPANSGFDPGETATVAFALQNAGYEATSNVVATLQATGGVTSPGPPQTYGALSPGSPPVSRPFSFTVGAACGGAVTATLQLQDGALNLGTVTYTFQIGVPSTTGPPTTKTYSYTGPAINIPDGSTVEVPINVTDSGAVSDVNVRVRLNHSFDEDLDIYLVGPDGTTVELSTGNGGSGDNYGSGLNSCAGTFTVFDDSAAASITAGSPPFDGPFKPEGSLADFNGKSLAGLWKLRITDDDPLITGVLGCWQLEIASRPLVCCTGPQCALLAGINQTGGVPGSSVIITGTNLTGVTAVRFANNVNAQFTVNSDSQITAIVPATAVAGSITISKPPCPDIQTAAFTVLNPAPTVSTLSPASAIAGTAGFTLTVNGANFVNGSVVRWNGSPRPTIFTSLMNNLASPTQLTASITAADIVSAGAVNVTVFNPAPGGGVSGALTFTINNPAPLISALNPNATIAGGAAFTLNVTGTNFVNGSVVRWNGSDRTTTFVSSTQVNVAVTAADIATSGTANITVFNPTPGGGTSGASTFTINNPVPTITQLDPNSTLIGGAAFTLNVTGTNFINNSVVRWNGSDRTTTYVSATQLRAAITAADIAAAGMVNVIVFNAGPGGGLSNASTFTVTGVPDLTIAKSHTGNFTVGASGVYTLRVTNNGSAATTGAITVTDMLPNGLSFRSADGSGWSCAANGQTVNCTNAGPLATGASSSFTLTVGVASAAAPSVTNTATVSTTGDTNSANNSASDPTTVVCDFAVSPLNHSFTSAGGQGSGAVTTETGCAWTAVSNATWITVNVGASGSGNGTVTFAVAANTTDAGRTGALTVAGKTVNVTQSARVTVVSAASFRAGEMSAESIGAAFGSNLATTTMAATTLPLPTELAGTTVKVRDGAGMERLCPLFFVAAGQINFIIAQGTANGAATVTVTSGSGAVSTGTLQIVTVAPTLFSANSDGQGPAAGVALRVVNGAQTFEPIIEFNAAQNRFVTRPIDLGEGEVFLILFGSGFRSRSSLSAVTCAIGGLSQEVLYVGASGDLVGVDQINVRLSRNLIGRGEVDVALTVDGKPANIVRANFR